MTERDYRSLLHFSDAWFALGILTEGDLFRYGRAFDEADDKNSEHYRFGAFHDFLRRVRPLSPQLAEALYDLGAADPDQVMGQSIMNVIVTLPECPPSVLERASGSGERHLILAAERHGPRPEQRRRKL
jgi:hypothetical protein